MDFVDNQRVMRGDEAVLEPAARDPGGHDNDVPGGRFRRRLALAIHDAHLEWRRENRLRHAANRQRLSRAGARHDAKPLP